MCASPLAYVRYYLPPSLFGALHEAGHGIYEQGVDPAYTRTPLATDIVGYYAVGGVSFGAHESQLRLYENHRDAAAASGSSILPSCKRLSRRRFPDVDAEGFIAP